MRIWSLHPRYLDSKGLVALWRETLLAKNVLQGNTRGYVNHPQLNRFKKMDNPLAAINQYLSVVYLEARARGYNFNLEKIDWNFKAFTTTVTAGQVQYETRHLLNKLKNRDPERFREWKHAESLATHPLFAEVVEGKVEDWEVLVDESKKAGASLTPKVA